MRDREQRARAPEPPEGLVARIDRELHEYDPDAGNLRAVGQVAPMGPEWHRRLIADFRAARIAPEPVEALMPGGVTGLAWAVTRPIGYRVLFLPDAGLFSLAVETRYGPVDIGVHGDALSVFGAIH